ncbi:MAG: hypothetical protein AAB547_03480 [Patescibacteria group bacterium]|mgnify:CR=1 FL=1
MGIEELSEKLHGRDVHLDRAEQRTPFNPGQGAADPVLESQFEKTEEWQKLVEKPSLIQRFKLADAETRMRRKNIAIVLGSIAGLILLGGLIFKVRSMLFSEERVLVSVTGPKNVASAEDTTFTVVYDNNNWAALNDATLILSYPESFRLQAGSTMRLDGALAEIPLGKIKANARGTVPITGKFYGSKGDLVFFKVTLRYTPKNLETVFETTTQFGVNVASSALSFEITAPLELATGQDVEYVVDYGNKSDEQFSNLRVKLVYPEGFYFVSAEPKPSEGESIWYVGNLNARADGKIIARGVLSGAREERKRVRGMIGFFQGDGKFVAYAENERQTRVVASPLSISQTVNGLTDIALNPGDVLHYVIRYRNDGNVGVRDTIITVEIDPSSLDMSRLLLKNGAYDAARKTIVWKASDIPSLGRLEQGAGGEISFSVPVLASIAASGKNLSVRSVAKIDSPDIPTPIGSNKIIGSNTLYVKLNALVGVDIVPFYTDNVFPNSGPIPPKVGQETSYTLRLKVTNSSNDLKQARISTIFPTGIRYSGKFAPAGETVVFNERTNELIWELGTFAATKNTPRELIFQISTIPSANQANKPLILVESSTFTAKDTFTNQDIRVERGEQNSFLQTDTDEKYKSAGSDVQPAE